MFRPISFDKVDLKSYFDVNFSEKYYTKIFSLHDIHKDRLNMINNSITIENVIHICDNLFNFLLNFLEMK